MTRHTVTITESNIHRYRTGSFNSSRLAWACSRIDRQVLSNFGRLRRLTIKEPLGQNGLEGIQVCRELRYLRINDSCDDINPIGALANLVTLIIKTTIPNIRPILTCTKLRTLRINTWTWHDEVSVDLTGIERLNELRHLHVNRNVPIPFSTLAQLQLVHLRVDHTGELVPMPQLVCICLGIQLTHDYNLTLLAMFPRLRSLEANLSSIRIHRTRFKLALSLDWLKPMTRLERLEIRGTGTLKDISAVTALTNLKTFSCKYEAVSSLRALSRCSLLRTLDCGGCRVTSLEGLGSCINLRQVRIWHFSFETPRAVSIKDLATCHNMRVFDGQHIKLLDTDIISNWTKLDSLNLSSTGVTDIAFAAGCSKLKYLDISRNSISSIDCLDAPCLENLDISYTTVDAVPFERYPALKYLYVSGCSIEDWSGLSLCTKLLHFRADECGLTTMDSITSPHLTWLSVDHNKLTTFPFEKYPRLQTLYVQSNKLTTIDNITCCPRLKTINLKYNRIADFSPICLMPSITKLRYKGNTFRTQDPRTTRVLQRFKKVKVRATNSIYADNQNVHNSSIQRSVQRSVVNLLKDPVIEFNPSSVIESDLSAEIKSIIIEYCNDDMVHSIHGLTYSELFAYVWARIQKHESKTELCRILADQIRDSECKCFTGRFNRTLSVLVGFCDDISINISDSARISAIVIAVGSTINPYSPAIHRELMTQALTAAGYETEEFRPWIDAIED